MVEGRSRREWDVWEDWGHSCLVACDMEILGTRSRAGDGALYMSPDFGAAGWAPGMSIDSARLFFGDEADVNALAAFGLGTVDGEQVRAGFERGARGFGQGNLVV